MIDIKNIIKYRKTTTLFYIIIRSAHNQTVTETRATEKSYETPPASETNMPNHEHNIVTAKTDPVISIEETQATLANDAEKLNRILQARGEPALNTDIKINNTIDSIQAPVLSDTNNRPEHKTENSQDSDTSHPLDHVISQVIIPEKTTSTASDDSVKLAVSSIKASVDILAQKSAQRLSARGVLLEETELATKRQEALYHRIEQWLSFYGISRRMIIGGLSLVKHGQIPLGGFIKGLSSHANAPSTSTLSHNSVNNITIIMPGADAMRAA